ncbi:phage Gp37/Gp68 family protein [Yoonia sp. 208BN28-4]|uniref:phage Gp37/Gp68 family protein n=1 Tax=Yoonia sp. 208BN28-4 TaxID=3126505 RepID=UPI003099D14D
MDNTDIEWTDATWNPVTGCTLVDAGCCNCYAATLAATRLKNHPSRKGLARVNAQGVAKFTGEVRFNDQWLTQPLKWRKPRMIFVNAHGDTFHPDVPDAWIDKIFAVMALCPQHTFQVLTKRPDRMRRYILGLDCDGARRFNMADAAEPIATDFRYWKGDGPSDWDLAVAEAIHAKHWPLPNVWLGTSVSEQTSADERIPALLDTPAAIRFISYEPALGPVDLRKIHTIFTSTDCLAGRMLKETDREAGPQKVSALDWVICGGESGPNARPMHPDWARSVRDQCAEAGVPFLFKQWGAWVCHIDRDNDDPDWRADYGLANRKPKEFAHINLEGGMGFHGDRLCMMRRVGKKAAGRLLDGVTHDGFPK